MKWEYDLETLRELSANGAVLSGDIIEALRAIAEQLERVAFLLEQRIIQDELKGTAQEPESNFPES